jgi:pilus assembly protein CpaC
MARLFSAKMLLASLALAPSMAILAPAHAQRVIRPSSQDVILSIGNGKLVNVGSPMTDIFVADDRIADVQIKSQRQLYVFGKSGGTTTVYASNARGDIIWSATIRVGSNIDSVGQMLALAMPDAKISVATMGTNTLLLTGTVAAPEDAAEAQRLVEAFVGGGSVISRLKTATPLQVNLRVRIAEVSRNFTRAIGVNLTTFDGTSGFKFGIGQGRTAIPQFTVPVDGAGVFTGVTSASNGTSLVTKSGSGSTLAAFGKFLGLDIGSALDLAETEGLVTTLAEPNLTALSGETASFLAGGEFPIVATNGLVGANITFKPYGVGLSYTPTVLSNGRISLRVRPEVSELGPVVTAGGVQIPSLFTRMAETTVELGSGQSFMIAGLIQNNAVNSIDKAPGLGDVPILGALFRSTSFRRSETELVIVVTPYLVKPIEERDVRLPTDGYRAPGELERVFGMQAHGGQSGGQRPMPTAVGGPAPAPQVSAGATAQPDAAATAQPSQPRREEKVAGAAPGFSFK